ncbi:homogentisate 1,2-dioxygenase [Legionella gresilensis]|uniref:homogentisate 1,2-dioxygenase n=1 Tax=Legionella gresilensis TaxID=91823 RepID=UPI0010413066|nr:homogentisate 1,2-dioxygenase [Legionella gresilensis]
MLAGFGNYHQTEAIAGALPQNQNSPQQCAYGLYAEQLSGSAFTRPRHLNLHSWLYRTAPSVTQGDYSYHHEPALKFIALQPPNPYRWLPLPIPTTEVDFVNSLFFIAGNQLVNTYLYQCTQSMTNRYFSNYDGEMLFVPYQGNITLFTEFGRLEIGPGQIAVIPRGVKFKVELKDDLACGYLAENLAQPLTLPSLGIIGSNGLANPRHFLYPVAAFEDLNQPVVLICKSAQHLWLCRSNYSPLNVVAWHGNYAPYSYDLSLFNTINTVSFDHPDPSIFTVLTSESSSSGIANLDFVIFPPRWMVAEHTFRPPYFHRNIMSELMGLIQGEYDAKKDGFLPGGISIHNCMTAHGPDSETYKNMIHEEQKPTRYENTLAFMFETSQPWLISEKAYLHPARQQDYSACWRGLDIAKL